MNPIDSRAAPLRVHRAGTAEDQDRNPINVGIENRHARMLQADHVVHDSDHRFALGFGIAVSNSDGDLLVIAKDNFRLVVATVIDNGVVDAAKRCARVKRSVLDIKSLHQIYDDVRTVLRLLLLYFALCFGHFPNPPLV